MTTCVRDLLQAVDDQTAPGTHIAPGDAAKAVSVLGRLLHRVTALDVTGWSDAEQHEQTRQLAEACAATNGILLEEPGRVADLLGAASDVVGVLRDDLTEFDGWEVAVAMAPVAMRCADTLRASGPYRSVHPIATVQERARHLIRLGAARPPDPSRGSGLDVALPSTVGGCGPAARTAYEPMAAILGHLRNRSRGPLTVVETYGVISAARAVAEERAASGVCLTLGDLLRRADAGAWREAEDRIGPIAADGITDCGDAGLHHHVAQVHDALARSSAGASTPAIVWDLERTAKLLPPVATLLQPDIRHLSGRLLVRRGERPVSEGRVGEWLREVAFIADGADLAPAIAALRIAGASTAPFRTPGLAAPTRDLHPAARSAIR